MKTEQIGDTVRLTANAIRRERLTLDVRHHLTARIVDTNDLLGVTAFVLHRELAGSCVWLGADLVLVKRGKVVPVTDLGLRPLKTREGFTPSNFSPNQRDALRAFEIADEANQGPAKHHSHRRELERTLINAFHAVRSAQIAQALCLNEMNRVIDAGGYVDQYLIALAKFPAWRDLPEPTPRR